MRCTCGHAYLAGMRDRPCNSGLAALSFYSIKNRTVKHETPVLVCQHCDYYGPRFWPNYEKESE